MKKILVIAAAVLLGSVSPSYGKGSPDKIIIFAGGLSAFELNDSETLKKFDPWGGQFVDWDRGPVSAPADMSHSCKVFFYMKWSGRRSPYDRGDLRMIYTVLYVPGRDGSSGFIYLPGKGEEFFENNSGTILRDHEDGKWHQASAEWDSAMTRLMH